jgi:cullin 3
MAATTVHPLWRTIEKHLLAPYLQTLVSMPGSGLNAMIDADRIHDLQRLYRLFVHASSPSDSLQILKKALKESIVNRSRLINDSGPGASANSDEKGKGKACVGTQAQTLEEALV